MIAYIRGRLEYVDLEEGMAVLETGGIGYQILLSGRDLELLPSAGDFRPGCGSPAFDYSADL